MSDIYEQIDGLYNQISASKAETESVKLKLTNKIKELQDICFRYAEEAYRFIGHLKQNYNIDQKDLDTYKYIIDSCISSEAYKKELEHKYITKDLKEYYKAQVDKVYEDLKGANEAFINLSLRDNWHEEDDTDTLVIIEKQPEGKKSKRSKRKTYKDGLKEAQEKAELDERWANYDPNKDMGQ